VDAVSNSRQPVSTLGHALLALIFRRPDAAYGLAQRLRRPVGYFWTAQYSQVHGELAKLLAAGLVTVEAAPGPGPHDKKIYAITDAGRAEVTQWVTEPVATEPNRNELLLKAYSLWAADRGAAVAMLTARLADQRLVLDEYEAMLTNVLDAHDSQVPAPDHPDFGNYATLLYGVGYRRNDIAWCERLLATLQRP
jgi:DNA-binding PadR family transcriptional regulator